MEDDLLVLLIAKPLCIAISMAFMNSNLLIHLTAIFVKTKFCAQQLDLDANWDKYMKWR